MGTLYESIKSLCDEKGIKGGKMCVDLGISKTTMTDLKTGRRAGISIENAQKIADYFGVSVDRVLGSEAKEKSSTPEGVELNLSDMELLDAFRNADDVTKELIRRALKLQ